MLLMIDNYDSFTYNLYQYLSELGAEIEVARNDKISLEEIKEISPGAATTLTLSPALPSCSSYRSFMTGNGASKIT